MSRRKLGCFIVLVAMLQLNLLSPKPVLAFQSLEGDFDFPYQAFALSDQAMVRSGPDQVHYATEQLEQGMAVQVYRHDPGGWCAIRPTQGSFSMIPESVVEIVEQNVGRVIDEGTQAWVGTRLGAVDKPLWQIKLRQGELVEILGEVSWPNPEGHSTIWYQIAPPAGEFRWMHRSDLQLPLPNTSIKVAEKSADFPSTSKAMADGQKTPESPDPATIAAASFESQPAEDSQPTRLTNGRGAQSNPVAGEIIDRRVQQAVLQQTPIEDQPVRKKEESLDDGWRVVTRKRPRGQSRPVPAAPESTTDLPNRFTAPSIPEISPISIANNPEQYGDPTAQPPAIGARYANAEFEANGELIQRDYATMPAAAAEDSQAMAPLGKIPATRIGDSLKELDFRLSREMIKSPPEWQIESIGVEAETLLNQSNDPAERNLANRILHKVNDCRQLRSKYRQNYEGAVAGTGVRNTAIGSGVNSDIELGTTYDAYGFLNQLARNGGTTEAEFVLQDANGRITYHVTPSPGLNLHRYLKSRVGIIGQRGYHQKLNLNHVTAERVVELNKLR